MNVKPEKFFAIVDGKMVDLAPQHELPDEFLAAIPQHLDSLLGVPTIAIGGWSTGSDYPISVAISKAGQISSIVAVHPTHVDSLGDTMTSVDEWLSTMTLRELSDLSGNNVEFYEGLLTLSPESSITLSPQRRYLVVTAGDAIDTELLSQRLPDAIIDVHYLDVMHAPGGPVIIRQRADPPRNKQLVDLEVAPVAPPIPEAVGEEMVDTPSATPSETEADSQPILVPDVPSEPRPEPPQIVAPGALWTDVVPAPDPVVAPSAEEAAVLEHVPVDEVMPEQAVEEIAVEQIAVEEIDLIALDDPSLAPSTEDTGLMQQQAPTFSVAPEVEPTETIDLTDQPSPPTIGFENPGHRLEQGGTYDVDALPLLFDSTGMSVESISNEMFAVSASIIIVVSLPERRRDSPFEDRRKFRWDTSLDRIQLLNEHGFTRNGTRRAVHLFVENERQPGYAAYVGELSRVMFQTQTESDSETAWFSISPGLPNDFFKLIRKGRLPSHTSQRSSAK